MNAATKADIIRWLEEATERGSTHLVVVCDTYDWSDYPVFVDEGEDVNEVAEKFRGKNMQKVMEVYSLTGKHSLESQLGERRAFHYD